MAQVAHPSSRSMAGSAAASGGIAPVYPGKGSGRSGIIPMPTRWWLRPVRMQARVGEQNAVVWKFVYRSPSEASRLIVGVAMGLP